MSNSKNILITVSGGRSSAMMARIIQTSVKYSDWNKVFVFCNTGMERVKTIDFLKKIETIWGIPLVKIEGVYSNDLGVGVGFKIVEWDDLDMNANVFRKMIQHKNKGRFHGLPFKGAPYCSSELKTRPSKKFADSIFGVNNYITAIGFRSEDMPRRISWPEINSDKKRVFPLIQDFKKPIDQLELTYWWRRQKFRLEIHSKFGNCQLCWKKSKNNLLIIYD